MSDTLKLLAPCLRCMRYHPAPPCDHDSTKPCFSCGQPRGYRWSGAKGELLGRAIECWRCWWAAQPVGSVQ
jgi:hypothetical protein